MPHGMETSLEETEKGLPSPPILSVSTRYRSMYRRVLRNLLPSFLSQHSTLTRDEIRPTDFLDGMRGYAAFIVYCWHFIKHTHPHANIGFHGNKGVNDYWINQLPILRLMYSGHVSVFLFFVISGFSISLKPLKLARSGSFSAFFDAIVSATFRRTCRLYLPCFATLAITFFMVCCGAFEFSDALTKKNSPFRNKPARIPIAYHSVLKQFRDFVSQVWTWSDPLARQKQNPSYGSQLWTIPIELRCSLLIYVALIGLAKVRPTIRMSVNVAMGVYFLLESHPEVTLFLSGTILAELYLIRQEHTLIRQEHTVSPPSRNSESRKQRIQSCLLFVLGLFFASYPLHCGEESTFTAPLYRVSSFLIGKSISSPNLFVTIGSVLLVYVVSRSPFLQDMFTTSVARYLGKTSFALYCVHQAMIDWFGYRSMLFFWSFTGHDTVFRFESGLVLAWIFQTIATIWVADIFWRFVDVPTISITKWLEEICSSKS
jgi:peptidoglycan/LPS O-acetylase OafA/YrhL